MSEGKLRKFYNSSEWHICREKLIIDRAKAASDKRLRCEDCGKALVDKGDVIVHHFPVELTDENVDDVMVALNPENLRIVCHDCHNKAHKRWQYSGRRERKERGVYIVYGPPMSGKTSYVRENMERGDIVIDMDKLFQAVTLGRIYDKPDNLVSSVITARDALIEAVRYRRGAWRAAWIVGGYPMKRQREKLAADLGAELIYIDVSKAECMDRLKACGDYRSEHAAEWAGYIDDWFDRFAP